MGTDMGSSKEKMGGFWGFSSLLHNYDRPKHGQTWVIQLAR